MAAAVTATRWLAATSNPSNLSMLAPCCRVRVAWEAVGALRAVGFMPGRRRSAHCRHRVLLKIHYNGLGDGPNPSASPKQAHFGV